MSISAALCPFLIIKSLPIDKIGRDLMEYERNVGGLL